MYAQYTNGNKIKHFSLLYYISPEYYIIQKIR